MIEKSSSSAEFGRTLPGHAQQFVQLRLPLGHGAPERLARRFSDKLEYAATPTGNRLTMEFSAAVLPYA